MPIKIGVMESEVPNVLEAWLNQDLWCGYQHRDPRMGCWFQLFSCVHPIDNWLEQSKHHPGKQLETRQTQWCDARWVCHGMGQTRVRTNTIVFTHQKWVWNQSSFQISNWNTACLLPNKIIYNMRDRTLPALKFRIWSTWVQWNQRSTPRSPPSHYIRRLPYEGARNHAALISDACNRWGDENTHLGRCLGVHNSTHYYV